MPPEDQIARKQSDLQPEAVSFAFLGTNHHRENKTHILTRLVETISNCNAHNFDDSKGKDHFQAATHFCKLFDGPGSKPKSDNSNHPAVGSTRSYFGDDGQMVRQEQGKYHSSWYKKIKLRFKGLITGSPLAANINESLQILHFLNEQGKLPKRVNLFGHSRGADTAVRLQNIISDLYPDIEINLLTIDHVPGPGQNIPSSRIIRKNVKHHIRILMTHETHSIYRPQTERDYIYEAPDQTIVNHQMYYGTHGSALFFKNEQQKSVETALTHIDVTEAALQWECYPKTENKSTKIPTSTGKKEKAQPTAKTLVDTNQNDRLNHYNKMAGYRSYYNKLFGKPNRSFLKRKELYVRDSAFFLSQEHRELFREKYPALFSYFFKQKQWQPEGINQNHFEKLDLLKNLVQYHEDDKNIKLSAHLNDNKGTFEAFLKYIKLSKNEIRWVYWYINQYNYLVTQLKQANKFDERSSIVKKQNELATNFKRQFAPRGDSRPEINQNEADPNKNPALNNYAYAVDTLTKCLLIKRKNTFYHFFTNRRRHLKALLHKKECILLSEETNDEKNVQLKQLSKEVKNTVTRMLSKEKIESDTSPNLARYLIEETLKALEKCRDDYKKSLIQKTYYYFFSSRESHTKFNIRYEAIEQAINDIKIFKNEDELSTVISIITEAIGRLVDTIENDKKFRRGKAIRKTLDEILVEKVLVETLDKLNTLESEQKPSLSLKQNNHHG